MIFNSRSLLVGACAFLFAGLATADACSDGPWTDVLSVGGGGGADFCHTKYEQGIIMTGIEVCGKIEPYMPALIILRSGQARRRSKQSSSTTPTALILVKLASQTA